METRTRKLRKTEWGRYFDALSKHLGAVKVNLVVVGLDLGAQIGAEKVPLEGISYDKSDDALYIVTAAFEHRIGSPREIYVQEDATGRLVSCKVNDEDGHEQIIQLDPSLLLAAS